MLLICDTTMTNDEIKYGETRTLEFKQELPDESIKWIKTVVAFANGAGGRLLVGVSDKGVAVGIPDNEDIFALRDRISNTIANMCSPQIMFDIYQESLDDKVLVSLEVFPGNDTPYFVKTLGKENGTFIRLNSITRIADTANLDELELRKKRKYYDELPFTEMEVADSDIQYLCNDFSQRSQTTITKQMLINMHLLQKIENNLLATKAYAIFLGRHDRLSRIQCARFKGTDRVYFLDKKDFDGPLLEQIDGAYKFVLTHINMAVEINGIVHDEIYELPVQAIRELIINAAIHRNYMIPSSIQVAVYDDRIEISSPGSLYGSLTLEEALAGRSAIRNKVIAGVCEKLKVIEGWGTGLKRIIAICKQNGIRPPVFEEIGDMLRATIYRRYKNGDKNGDKNGNKTAINGDKNGDKTAAINKKIINYILKNAPAKTRDIAEFIGLKPSMTKVYISRLVDNGEIIPIGVNKSRSYISPLQTTATYLENGDKTAAINDKNGDKNGDKTAVNTENGDKTATIEKIFLYLSKNAPAKTQDIANFIGLKTSRTKVYLANLIQEGKILAVGNFKHRAYLLPKTKETPE